MAIYDDIYNQPQPAPQGGLLSSVQGLLSTAGKFFGSPVGQGLLSTGLSYAANAGRKGMGKWNTLGAAGLSGLNGYTGAVNQESEDAQSKLRQKLGDAQVQNLTTHNQSAALDLFRKQQQVNFWNNQGGQAPSVPATQPASVNNGGTSAEASLPQLPAPMTQPPVPPQAQPQPMPKEAAPQPEQGLFATMGKFIGSPVGQGLLSSGLTYAANAGRKGVGPWNNAGAAGLAGLQGYEGAQQAQQQEALDGQRVKLLGAQHQGIQTQNDADRLELDQKQRKVNYLSGLPSTPGGENAGPAPATAPQTQAANAPQAGQPRINPLDALRHGYSIEEARALADMNTWGAPKVSRYVEAPSASGGIEMVGLDEYGKPINTGVKPWKEPVWRDTGGQEIALDPVTLREVKSLPKTMTPGEVASDRRAGQRIALDRDQPRGVVVQTDQGPMLVDPRSGAGSPITGPDGNPVSRPLAAIPGAANTAMLANSQNLAKINQAIELLDGKDVGALKGDKSATGWKGYLPQSVLNRADPQGTDARAMISDIGSLVLHDRSGAAVTASESPRLLPFIPLATDDAATAKKKLTRFKQLYEQEQQAMQDMYSRDQGYRSNPAPQKANRPPLEQFNGTKGQRPSLSNFERK
ncbi:hypothetical protein [Aquabacterium sp. CECT 9606]|uniref:hypothetical protein n=1 Tax=Aquabacterium sp. CECT 9606 TaxID=2845822 RepID=UPI001E632780|nr:hypothetical protein [Aquabacterium sp. CECT 9606]CAH0354057.1 hypothetical protein AQB9606_03453 [Aquabacterium sp. CECT 9606]